MYNLKIIISQIDQLFTRTHLNQILKKYWSNIWEKFYLPLSKHAHCYIQEKLWHTLCAGCLKKLMQKLYNMYMTKKYSWSICNRKANCRHLYDGIWHFTPIKMLPCKQLSYMNNPFKTITALLVQLQIILFYIRKL